MGVKKLIYSVLLISLFSCAERAESTVNSINVDPVERQRMYLAQERQILQGYIDQHQLEGIERNGYGMYELSISEGDGLTSEMGDRIIYNATVYLMDDSGVGQYTDTVDLGMSEMEIGLHEALSGMKEGEKKLVLIPSFLARGLAGDLDKVPPQSPLRYDLRLIQIVR